jgi:nucleoid DNA-binding protein
MERNPATEEAIQIKASKKVAFRAVSDLKMAANSMPGNTVDGH